MPSLGPTSNQPTTNSQQRTATRVAGVGVNGKQSGNNGSKDTKLATKAKKDYNTSSLYMRHVH